MKLEQAARQVLQHWASSDDLVGAITAPRKALAEQAEQDLDTCPGCGGVADNGHDREFPPNPYYCTKCTEQAEQEPVAWVDLTKEELHQIEMTCETSAKCYRVIAKALKDRNYAALVAAHEREKLHNEIATLQCDIEEMYSRADVDYLIGVEREACAKLREQLGALNTATPQNIAASIRARVENGTA